MGSACPIRPGLLTVACHATRSHSVPSRYPAVPHSSQLVLVSYDRATVSMRVQGHGKMGSACRIHPDLLHHLLPRHMPACCVLPLLAVQSSGQRILG